MVRVAWGRAVGTAAWGRVSGRSSEAGATIGKAGAVPPGTGCAYCGGRPFGTIGEGTTGEFCICCVRFRVTLIVVVVKPGSLAGGCNGCADVDR